MYVSRNKCVDASLQTMIVQAKASSVPTPQTVSASKIRTGCPMSLTVTGKGTRGEYTNILQAAQASAIGAPCSNTPADTGVSPQITLSVPCINYNAPPWTQQNMSSFYTAPCTNPGKIKYFPALLSNGPGCATTKITTPSG